MRCHLAQKTVSAARAYQCFFEIYDELEENKLQQRLLLKQKFFENFDSDSKQFLEEKSKILQWVVEKVPFLQNIEIYCTDFIDCRKYTLRAYKLAEATKPNYNEVSKLEKNLKAENVSE